MFKTLRIQAQIWVLIFLMIGAFAALGAVMWWSKISNDANDRAVLGTLRGIEVTDRIRTNLSLSFGSHLSFLQQPSERFAGVNRLHTDRALQDLAQALPELKDTKELAATTAAVKDYAQQFGRVAALQRKLGFTEKEGLQGAIWSSADDLQNRLEREKENPRFLIGLLQIRIAARNHAGLENEAALQKFNETIAGLARDVASSQLAPSDRRALASLLSRYADQVAEFAKIKAELNAAAQDMRKSAGTALVHLHDLNELMAARARHTNVVVMREKADARSATTFLILLVMGVTSLIALILGRDIAKPLQDMTRAMRRLSKGRLDTRFPALEYKNELGELAESFEVFKENALNMRMAEQELARAEKLASLGSLVAGIAHELNTPTGNSLTVATALRARASAFKTELENGQLKRSVLSEFVENVTEGTKIVEGNLERLSDLVGKFKQVAVDQTSDRRRPFDLKSMIEELMVILNPMLKNQPHGLHVDIPDDIRLDSYPGPLGQVLSNLCANALIHAFEGTPEGRMLLTASEDEGTGEVVISFSDNGKGITEENLGRIFDPFFTTRLGSGGSGLGLNIVYNIVKHTLGGDIAVHSTPGEGTRFDVTIPLIAPGTAEDEMLKNGAAA